MAKTIEDTTEVHDIIHPNKTDNTTEPNSMEDTTNLDHTLPNTRYSTK